MTIPLGSQRSLRDRLAKRPAKYHQVRLRHKDFERIDTILLDQVQSSGDQFIE
jgi:hypothetical protein